MKQLLPILFILIVGLGVLVFLQRNINSLPKSQGKLSVTASFYPMYFFASQIGGNKAMVYTIIPASAEPHDYEPTTKDIARIEQSDLLVLNGGAIESWGSKIKDELSGKGVDVIVAGDGVATKMMIDSGRTIRDPHVWQDPILAKEEVANIEKGFEKADRKDAPYFQSNAKVLDRKLDELYAQYKVGLDSCALKDFVTSHAAFAYMAQRFGINQIAISGVSPDEEPSSQKLAEITSLVKKEGIKVIFFESLVSPKLSDTIAQETGAKTLVLDPLEGIVQKDAVKGANYFSVMRQNLQNLQIALQCNK